MGLILGAGGIAGGAWHAGALAALEEAGWDPRGAELIVGTSAGAGTAATLRLGVPASDLIAAATGRPLSDVGEHHRDRAGPLIDIPAPPVGGPRRPQAPMLVLRTLARPLDLRPVKALAGLLPAGQVDAGFIADRIRRAHVDPWPEQPTWICAVRLRDGERVVFGRDVVDVHVATAVHASSAVPGYFRPVEHAGEIYVDGGVHSPTNADLAAGCGFDVVVVSSPMSATAAALRRPRWSGARGLHAAVLAREVRRVRASGAAVLVLQPDAAVVDTVGPDSMDVSRREAVAGASYESVARHLRSPRVADRLSRLRSATRRP